MKNLYYDLPLDVQIRIKNINKENTKQLIETSAGITDALRRPMTFRKIYGIQKLIELLV